MGACFCHWKITRKINFQFNISKFQWIFSFFYIFTLNVDLKFWVNNATFWLLDDNECSFCFPSCLSVCVKWFNSSNKTDSVLSEPEQVLNYVSLNLYFKLQTLADFIQSYEYLICHSLLPDSDIWAWLDLHFFCIQKTTLRKTNVNPVKPTLSGIISRIRAVKLNPSGK